LRNVRRDIKEAVEKLEKEKKMSEDDKKRALDELEKVTHSETKKVDDLLATKEKELMSV
jgi:ribosome recycling factor